MSRLTWGLGLIATLAFAGCGDDDGGGDDDTPTIDAALDNPDAPPGEPDATPYSPPTAMALPLSATGPDQLFSAAAGPGGSFYAAAFTAADPTAAKNVVVLKLTAAGALDTGFGGGDGIADTGLVFVGGNDEIDLVVQPSGKIVVAATIADETVAGDSDIGLVRLEANGAVDGGFGTAGVLHLDLSTAIDNGMGTLVGGDRSRGLAVDATGRLYVHGVQRGEGDFMGAPRTDTDFVLARVDVDGAGLDVGFASSGKHLVDLRRADNTPLNATPRGVHVLADGCVIASGYTSNPDLATGPQPVLYKLDSSGAPVGAFAANGIFHDAVLSVQTEVYDIAVHGDGHFVTAGYGRESGDQNDWVSMRFDATTGARDTTFGGAPNGAVLIDPSGMMIGDNCRSAAALPGGKTLLIGSTGPGNMPAQDAVFAVLDATGHLDAAYGTGLHIYAFGDGAGGNDQLWGATVSGDNVLIVGYRGGGPAAMQTTTTNDDSYAILLPLE